MTSGHPQPNQLESGVRIGDFEIEKRLGAGGMGIVYQARQVSLNRKVALKVLGPALTQGSDLARFQREAQAVARLKHPGIAALHFIGQDAEVCYHVMELVEGVPLRKVLERLAETSEVGTDPDSVVASEMAQAHAALPIRFDQPTTDHVDVTATQDDRVLSAEAKQVRRSQTYIRRCCEIVRDVARALAYAHGEGVVHRDIKPENLMLDRQGQVHVIDFGLARFFDDVSITNTGQLVGTPLYMSPEQVTGRIKVDHRTDIYSLGLVLYELLTLRRPIEFTSRENLLRNIVTKSLPPLCCRNRALPRGLESVVHKATHKDPEERYQGAAELAEELDRFLAGKPVSAPAYHYRLDVRETVASRPGVVVLSAFLCLLAGITLFTGLASVALMMSAIVAGQFLIVGTQLLMAVTILAGGAVCAHGLLAGWNWTRWVVIVLAAVAILGCLVVGVGLWITVVSFPGTENPAPAQGADAPGEAASDFNPRSFLVGMALMYTLPVLLALLCAVTTIVSLLRPSTAAWFHRAQEARLEHQRVLSLLGD